jgi:hypothetical protein
MAGGYTTRSDFRALMADGLKIIFDDYTQDLEEEFNDIFNMETSERAYETELGFVGLGGPSLTAETELPRYDGPKQGRPVTYINNKYALGVAVSYEAKEDDRYGKIASSIVPELTRSFKVERNQQAADILNNAFTYQGYEPDGVALCSSAHPLIVPGGTYVSNLLSLPLGVAGLQAARARLRRTRSESNKIMPMIGETLCVGPSLESLAEELLQSTLKPGSSGYTTQPNDKNVMMGKFKIKVMNYLRDDGTYFVTCAPSKTKLKWFDRKKLYNRTKLDDEVEAVKMIAFARWAKGFSDWRGIVGYLGTG